MRRHIAFFIGISTCFASTCLAQTRQWDRTYGGTGEDRGGVIRPTSDGGYIIGGGSSSPAGGDKTENARGGEDYWIVKVDRNGVKQWDRTFGGSNGDWFGSIDATSDGGCIVAGSSASPAGGDKTEGSRGAMDYWVVKVDRNGLKQWDRTFGGPGYESPYRVRQTGDGGYILAGSSDSSAGGDKTQPSQGNADFWIVKIDANGVKQWDRTLGGSDVDTAYDVQQTVDGGYLVGGSSASPAGGDKTQPSQGGTDFWIVSVDSNGLRRWDGTYGGSDSDELSSLLPAPGGTYWLGGYSASPVSGDKTQPSQGGFDYWIVNVNSTGLKLWDRTLGGSGAERLLCMCSTADGGLLLGGNSSSPVGGDKTQPSQGIANTMGAIDYWLVNIDPFGVKRWDRTFGGTGLDSLASVEVAGDGALLLGGWSESPRGTDKTEESRGFYDYWLLKYGYLPGTLISVQ